MSEPATKLSTSSQESEKLVPDFRRESWPRRGNFGQLGAELFSIL